MQMLSKIVLAISPLFLAACGGGTSDSTPSSVCAGHPPVKVGLIGDSTMWGWLTATQGQAANNPGVRLQHDMDARFGAGSVIVTNYAVSGTTSLQAPHVSADVIVANYGINDARLGVSLADYAVAMKATGATLIETPNPTYGYPWDDAAYAATSAGLGIPVADTHAYVLSLPDWHSMIADGAHPDEILYMDIVDNVLAPAVAKQVISHCQ